MQSFFTGATYTATLIEYFNPEHSYSVSYEVQIDWEKKCTWLGNIVSKVNIKGETPNIYMFIFLHWYLDFFVV